MLQLLAIVGLATACLGSPHLDGKIVGGHNVNIQDYPYQSNDVHICGAVIISPNWALTAARCSAGNVGSITLRAGTSSLEAGGKVYTVARKIIHTQYNVGTSDYDIALLRISDSFDFVSGVGTISLPDQNEAIEDGAEAKVSGWGFISEGGSLHHHLQAVTIPIVSQTDCQAAYGVSAITPRMICAGLPQGGKDACEGDSGGPLVSGGKLVGLVSWGDGCAKPNYPGVYTRVANMRDWIKTNSAV